MVNRREIKDSEARIIIYLNTVHKSRKYVTAISAKLNIDYSYLMRVLNVMLIKNWVTKFRSRKKVYYELTQQAPIEQAQALLLKEHIVDTLNDFMDPEVTNDYKFDSEQDDKAL